VCNYTEHLGDDGPSKACPKTNDTIPAGLGGVGGVGVDVGARLFLEHCRPGEHMDADTGKCMGCSPGQYQDEDQTTRACSVCPQCYFNPTSMGRACTIYPTGTI
jgi:hypothetical protein